MRPFSLYLLFFDSEFAIQESAFRHKEFRDRFGITSPRGPDPENVSWCKPSTLPASLASRPPPQSPGTPWAGPGPGREGRAAPVLSGWCSTPTSLWCVGKSDFNNRFSVMS